jgi:hypothetical protein
MYDLLTPVFQVIVHLRLVALCSRTLIGPYRVLKPNLKDSRRWMQSPDMPRTVAGQVANISGSPCHPRDFEFAVHTQVSHGLS